MDIGAFKGIGPAAMGRVTTTDNETATASSTTKMGKTLSRIGDFFARFSKSGRQEQATQNTNIREQFAQALTAKYGDSAQGAVARLTDAKVESKPLMAREVRSLIADTKLLNRIDNIQLSVPGHAGRQGISRSMVPMSTVAAMKGDVLQEQLQSKINNGGRIVSELRAGTLDLEATPPTQKNVADVMWFLQMSAQAKTDTPFKAGAVTLTDPGGRIKSFLDGSQEAYQRKSSHLGAFQKLPGGTHRGIDMKQSDPGRVDDLLPNGRATILYGGLGKSHALGTDRTMLFVKMESHGCRLAPPSSKDRDETGPAGRPVRLFEDLKQTLGHTFSFLSGIGARASGDHGADSRKERINKSEVDGYKSLVEAFPEGMRPGLEKGDPLDKSGGIRVMLKNIDEMKGHLDNFITGSEPEALMDEIDLDDDPYVDAPPVEVQQGGDEGMIEVLPGLGDVFFSEQEAGRLRELLQDFENGLRETYGSELDTLNLRIGNEVILGDTDIPRNYHG